MPNVPLTSRMALRLLKDLIGAFGWHYVVFVACTIAFGGLMLLPAQLFRYFTVTIPSLGGTESSDFLVRLFFMGLAIGAVLFLSSLASTLYQEWFRLRLESILRRRVMKTLHDMPLTALDGTQRGDWLMRMSGDLGRVEMFFGETIPTQVRNIGILVGSSALFFAASGSFAFIALVAAILLGCVSFLVQKRLSPILSELRSLHGGIFQMLIENYEGLRTIRTHRAEGFLEARLESGLREITGKSMKVVRSLGALIGGTEFGSQLMIVICLLGATYALSKGQLTVEQILVYPFFLGLFYSSAQTLASTTYDWNRYFVEGGRLGELLYNNFESCGCQPSFESEPEKLSVMGLRIGYGGKSVAGPFDFEVKKGELSVVMGPSGCGKTTLLEVLSGLRPAVSGKAELCGKYAHCSCTSIFNRVFPVGICAYVEQSPYIFEGTLRENLLFGKTQTLDGAIWDVLLRVGLEEFARKNGGLDYFLQDRGRNLSQGERYRIALGRALLLNRPFLLIDEPFSALDEASVEIVVSAIKTEKSKAGIVLVTHLVPDSLKADQKWLFTKAGFVRERLRLDEKLDHPRRVEVISPLTV